MAKKKARTRKEMFDMLSPEEQETALREMTFPYPLSEAVEPDVAEKELRRRYREEEGIYKPKFDAYRAELELDRRSQDPYKKLGHRHSSDDGQQRMLEQMVKNQAAKMIVDAVRDQIEPEDLDRELSRHPSLPDDYEEKDRYGKAFSFGSELAKNVRHYNEYPSGKYAFGKNAMPEKYLKELLDMGISNNRGIFGDENLVLDDNQAGVRYHLEGNELYNRKKKKGKK